MSATSPFRDTITSVEELRTHYRAAGEVAILKERQVIDSASQAFLERCRFAVIGTHDAQGNADTSPRGGESGFITVIDETHLAIADLNGNNRLDSLQNIVDTGRIGAMFVVPGQSETVRVNGKAWITVDPEILARFTLPKRPKAAIGIEVESIYVHCAKAFMRGGLWKPEVWAELADTPDGAQILVCQGLLPTEAASRDRLDTSYARDLAADSA